MKTDLSIAIVPQVGVHVEGTHEGLPFNQSCASIGAGLQLIADLTGQKLVLNLTSARDIELLSDAVG